VTSSTSTDSRQLRRVLQRHSIAIPDPQVDRLAAYCQQLWTWNERLNLTRHTDFEAFVTRDLVDSLRLENHLPPDCTVLDVGSGGGVPGLVLAIVRPDLSVSLAESVAKKAKALTAITQELKLPVPVYAERAESLLKSRNFGVLTIRAVASLRKLLFWFQQQGTSFDRMLLIKGPRWSQELEEAEEQGLVQNVRVEKIDQYRSPGHDNDSVILSVQFGRK
jgi:16S rRNA (guanine527-N7)-methyltransferase